MSLALAHDMALKPTLLDEQGGGAAGVVAQVYRVEDAQLEVADRRIRLQALPAMDNSHANDTLALQGAAPVEAIMAIDVFDKHAAVIDYGSRSLFLRP